MSHLCVSSIILSIPICWGIYEFRQMRLSMDNVILKMDNISNSKVDDYPFLNEIKSILEKTNRIINIVNEGKKNV